jgi:predicted RNA-binding Zn ribbon-like protein
MLAAGDATGDQPFTFRSGHIALDFAATLMFRSAPGAALELLGDGAALAGWARAAGLGEVAAAGAALADAVATREAIYSLSLARLSAQPLPLRDLARLNAVATGTPLTLNLAGDGTLSRSGSAAQLLATLARDALELLGGPDAANIRQCSREGCTRLYIDRSRGATRVWCGMRECGNRVNAAAYRRRRSARRDQSRGSA